MAAAAVTCDLRHPPDQLAEHVGRDAEVADLSAGLRPFLERQTHQHLRSELTIRAELHLLGFRLGLRQRQLVARLHVDQILFAVLELHLGVHLAALDDPLFLDRRGPPGVDGLVGLLLQLLAGIGLERLPHLRRRLDAREVQTLDHHPERFEGRILVDRHQYVYSQIPYLGQRVLERQPIHVRTGVGLHGVDKPLREFFRVLGAVAPTGRIDGEVEQLGAFQGIGEAIGQAALDGDGLEVTRGFVEDERRILRDHRDERNRGVEGQVPEREPGAVIDDSSPPVTDHVDIGFTLEVFEDRIVDTYLLSRIGISVPHLIISTLPGCLTRYNRAGRWMPPRRSSSVSSICSRARTHLRKLRLSISCRRMIS